MRLGETLVTQSFTHGLHCSANDARRARGHFLKRDRKATVVPFPHAFRHRRSVAAFSRSPERYYMSAWLLVLIIDPYIRALYRRPRTRGRLNICKTQEFRAMLIPDANPAFFIDTLSNLHLQLDDRFLLPVDQLETASGLNALSQRAICRHSSGCGIRG